MVVTATTSVTGTTGTQVLPIFKIMEDTGK